MFGNGAEPGLPRTFSSATRTSLSSWSGIASAASDLQSSQRALAKTAQSKQDCDRFAPQSVSSSRALWPYSPLAPGLSETEAMTTLAPNETQLVDRIEEVGTKIQKVRETTASVIFGQDRVIDLALITVLSGGHALLIGVPGLAQTSLVETLGTVLGLENKRIQFTPDLMPSDIVGSEVLEEGAGGRRGFRFVKVPIFTQLLMADEINRASPKTQSALLQAMQEHHVTVAGVRHDVPRPFHVLATQNPLEQEGTYPLPEAQLARFLPQIDRTQPHDPAERAVVFATTGVEDRVLKTILSADELMMAQRLLRRLPRRGPGADGRPEALRP